jgi:serine/threonine protein phosphatase PrpC
VTIAWSAAGATHVGRVREGNEDAFRVDLERGIFLVADGMGGHAAGEIASGIAARVVHACIASALDAGARGAQLPGVLREAMLEAHAAIVTHCAGTPEMRGMGTTLTAAVVEPSGGLHLAHIGDSRIYLLAEGRLEQLTRDHTWVEREVEAGRITAAEARRHPLSHILTHVLTDDSAPVFDISSRAANPGDLLLLVTDGLYNMLSDTQIEEIATSDLPLPARIDALITEANRAGGTDNITAILIGLSG